MRCCCTICWFWSPFQLFKCLLSLGRWLLLLGWGCGLADGPPGRTSRWLPWRGGGLTTCGGGGCRPGPWRSTCRGRRRRSSARGRRARRGPSIEPSIFSIYRKVSQVLSPKIGLRWMVPKLILRIVIDQMTFYMHLLQQLCFPSDP